MVPLDVDAIAARLDVERVSVRGRLYYHPNPLYEQSGLHGRKPL
jgi:hypothetical protein